MQAPLGRISPVSSKTTTPLQRRFQPCSGWPATMCAASRSGASKGGHRGVCWQEVISLASWSWSGWLRALLRSATATSRSCNRLVTGGWMVPQAATATRDVGARALAAVPYRSERFRMADLLRFALHPVSHRPTGFCSHDAWICFRREMSARARGGNGCLLDGVVGPGRWWSWHQRLGMAPELREGGQDSIAAEASIVEGLDTEIGQQLTEVVLVWTQPGARQVYLQVKAVIGAVPVGHRYGSGRA